MFRAIRRMLNAFRQAQHALPPSAAPKGDEAWAEAAARALTDDEQQRTLLRDALLADIRAPAGAQSFERAWEAARARRTAGQPRAFRRVDPTAWSPVWHDEVRLVLAFLPATPGTVDLVARREHPDLDRICHGRFGQGAAQLDRGTVATRLWTVSVLRGRDTDPLSISVHEGREPVELGMQRYSSHTPLGGHVRLPPAAFDELADAIRTERVPAQAHLHLMIGAPHDGPVPHGRPITWNGHVDDPVEIDLQPTRLWLQLSHVPAPLPDGQPVPIVPVRAWMLEEVDARPTSPAAPQDPQVLTAQATAPAARRAATGTGR